MSNKGRTREELEELKICSNETLLELVRYQRSTLDRVVRMCYALSLASFMVIVGAVTTIGYFILNYEIEWIIEDSTEVTQTIEGDGDNIYIDAGGDVEYNKELINGEENNSKKYKKKEGSNKTEEETNTSESKVNEEEN